MFYGLDFQKIHLRLLQDQPSYQCFEHDPEPVDTTETFEKHCVDYEGNIFVPSSTVTSCCECFM